MTGLIQKDFLSLRRYLKSTLFFLLAYNVIFIAVDQASIATIVTVYIFSNLSVSVFAYDESCHWDTYARSLPLSHAKVVLSRYFMSGISVAAGILCGIFLTMIDIAVNGISEYGLTTSISSVLSISFANILIQSFTIPLIYRFGISRARVFTILGFAILFLALFSSIPFLKTLLNSSNLGILAVTVLLFLAVCVVLSYHISCHIYEKRKK